MRNHRDDVAEAEAVTSERAVALLRVLDDVDAVDGAGAGTACGFAGMRTTGADDDEVHSPVTLAVPPVPSV